jgi:hypothetical protein
MLQCSETSNIVSIRSRLIFFRSPRQLKINQSIQIKGFVSYGARSMPVPMGSPLLASTVPLFGFLRFCRGARKWSH